MNRFVKLILSSGDQNLFFQKDSLLVTSSKKIGAVMAPIFFLPDILIISFITRTADNFSDFISGISFDFGLHLLNDLF